MTDELEAQIHDIIGWVADRVGSETLPERSISFLEPEADLWRYSPENLAAIPGQNGGGVHEPSLLGTFRQWRELGRIPLAGETPFDFRVPLELDVAPHLQPGRSVPEFLRGQTRGEWLWDVEQTFGRPMSPPPLSRLQPHDNARRLFVALSDLVHELGFTIRMLRSQRGRDEGSTDHRARVIEVAGWRNPSERAAILAHETFHAYLHGPDDPVGAKYGHSVAARSIAELEVEIGTHVVLASHGIDSEARTGRAVAFWSDRLQQEMPEFGRDARSPTRSALVHAVEARVAVVAKTILTASDALGGDPRTAPDSLRQRLHTPADLEEAGYRPHPPRSGPGLG